MELYAVLVAFTLLMAVLSWESVSPAAVAVKVTLMLVRRAAAAEEATEQPVL